MIFDFKDELTSTIWDRSNLVLTPPKSIKDYLISTKNLFVENINLTYPFIVVFIVTTSLNYYSFRLLANITNLQASHRSYQERRSSIIAGKRDLDNIDSFVSSLSPFVSDSIYPIVFLSYLSPILTSDSSLAKVSLAKNSSSLIVNSTNIDLLSSAFSTLDQHPLVQPEDISFTSIKNSTDNSSQQSTGVPISNQIEIKFTYNYIGIPLLSPLFDQSNSYALKAKSSFFVQ